MQCIPQVLIASAVLFTACGTSEPPPAEVQAPPAEVEAPPTAVSARPTHWGYSGDVAPATWNTLDPVYALCGNGMGQSPIDVNTAAGAGGSTWEFNYGSSSLHMAHNEHVEDLLDNGHTIQLSVEEGSTLKLGGNTYHLKQFHFHTPSEHTVDGKHTPMEMHMVHASDDGKLAVVSVMIEEGKANENFAKIIEYMPAAPGDTVKADHKLVLDAHMPNKEKAYHYTGSLTTPPCTEGVEWLVLTDRITLSADQIKAFASRMNNNNRPVQKLNERSVTKDARVAQAK
ncbi:MAG: carbonic anhydrase family protein [Flavobacteriales bacterium]